jgi:hypothetical protein
MPSLWINASLLCQNVGTLGRANFGWVLYVQVAKVLKFLLFPKLVPGVPGLQLRIRTHSDLDE